MKKRLLGIMGLAAIVAILAWFGVALSREKAANTSLRTDNLHISNARYKLEEEKWFFIKNIGGLKEDKTSLEGLVKGLEKKVSDSRGAEAKLEKDKSKLRGEIANLKNANDELRSSSLALGNRVNELNIAKSELEADKSTLAGQADRMQAEFAEINAEYGKLKSVNDDLQKQVKETAVLTPVPALTPTPAPTPTPVVTPAPAPALTVLKAQVVVSRCEQKGVEGARVIIWAGNKERKVGEGMTDASGVVEIAGITPGMKFVAEVFATGYPTPVYPAQTMPNKEKPFVQFRLKPC